MNLKTRPLTKKKKLKGSDVNLFYIIDDKPVQVPEEIGKSEEIIRTQEAGGLY